MRVKRGGYDIVGEFWHNRLYGPARTPRCRTARGLAQKLRRYYNAERTADPAGGPSHLCCRDALVEMVIQNMPLLLKSLDPEREGKR